MSETRKHGSPTSADSPARVPAVPGVVQDHARDLEDSLRLGLLAAALAAAAVLQGGLVALCLSRPQVPLYVLGG